MLSTVAALCLLLLVHSKAYQAGKEDGIQVGTKETTEIAKKHIALAHKERAQLIVKYLYQSCTTAKKFQLPLKGPDGKLLSFSCYIRKEI